MKRKLSIFFTVLIVLTLVGGSIVFADSSDSSIIGKIEANASSRGGETYGELEVINNSLDTTHQFIFDLKLSGPTRIYGVVSSADNVDWFQFCNKDDSGIASFVLWDEENAGNETIVLEMSIHDENGALIYKAFRYNNDYLVIDNYYMPKNTTRYIKVQYLSGVPIEPYSLTAYLDTFRLSEVDSIINKEDLDL